jgi:hypothetical protein
MSSKTRNSRTQHNCVNAKNRTENSRNATQSRDANRIDAKLNVKNSRTPARAEHYTIA